MVGTKNEHVSVNVETSVTTAKGLNVMHLNVKAA